MEMEERFKFKFSGSNDRANIIIKSSFRRSSNFDVDAEEPLILARKEGRGRDGRHKKKREKGINSK